MLSLLAAIGFLSVASAQPFAITTPSECGPFQTQHTKLVEQYKETPRFVGTVDENIAVHFYEGKESWTLTLTHTNGIMCYVSAGVHSSRVPASQ